LHQVGELPLGPERIRQPRIVRAAIDRDDAPAFPREGLDGGGADAAGGAGDESDPAHRTDSLLPHRGTAPATSAAASATTRSPSSAEAPLGSPSTPLGLTTPTPPPRSSSISSPNGAMLPAAARSIPTSSGRRASISEVSTRPAWASPLQRGDHPNTSRPSSR